ncbi:MAG TPA: hypothetical protein VD794_14805 [Flavisolibacter sp.]|nr:hypothetical protein [Flavisolibacter sp.]
MNKLIIPKYCDSNSILLINSSGLLRRLYCPFRVKSKASLESFKPRTILWVDEVAANSKDELIYYVLGKPYKHLHFELHAIF